MNTITNGPVALTERAGVLDALRGLAVFGIFLNNIFGFSGYGYMIDADQKLLPTYPVDDVLSGLQHIFIEGKFYSIFSLLFGIGFSIILFKNGRSVSGSLLLFYRRLLVLFIIGFIHCYFIWDGDILLLYAMIGCLLPLFRNCSDRSLLLWAVFLVLSPILIDVIKYFLQWGPGDFLFKKAQSLDTKNGIPITDEFTKYLYKEGSGWREWRNWTDSGIYYRYEYILNSNRIPKVLGMFILGFYAGRKGMHLNLEQYKPLFIKLRLWGFIIGLPASIARVIFEDDGLNIYKSAYGLLDTFFYAISVVPLSLAYVSWFCLYWIKKKENNKLRVFVPVGRMALSNYILQTLLGIFIFYGVGLGLGSRVGPSLFYPIAMGIFIFQLLISNFWFRYFRYGPLEWIWRQLTYGKALPLRK